MTHPPEGTNRYPFYLGGAASMMAGILVHPADQTKIRAQTQTVRQGMFRTLACSYRRGGFVSLWDGTSATMLRAATYATARFGLYGSAKSFVKDRENHARGYEAPLPMAQLVGCGVFAGALAGLVGVPSEVVLVRMCSDAIKPPSQQLHYKNAIDGLLCISRNEGPRQLYRGAGTVMARSCILNGSQLASYDVIKRTLITRTSLGDNAGTHIISSFIAGTISLALCAPVDVLKSRIQNTVGGTVTFREVLRTALKEEGISVLGRGFLPSWTRLMPSTILTFVFLEQLKSAVDRNRGTVDLT